MNRDTDSHNMALKESANRAIKTALVCVLLLIAIGWVMLLDSGLIFEGQANPEHFHNLIVKRMLGTSIGLAILVSLWLMPAGLIRKFSFPAILIGLVLLALVWSPLGITERGSTRWEQLGPFRFQPLEFAKLALVWFLADQLARIGSLGKVKMQKLVVPAIFAVLTIGLVGAQPNISGAIFLIMLVFVMAWVGGINGRLTLGMLAGGTAAFAGLLALNPDKLARFLPVVRPFEDISGAGYQVGLSLWAIAKGGLFGLGPGGSVAMYSLPDHATDFIFSILGEEWGFAGGITVILLFAVLIYSGFRIALVQQDPFRILLGCGITSIIGLQAAINIGVVLGILPTTGMPLPFLSAGGSNLILSFIEIGLLMNLGKTAGVPIESKIPIKTPEVVPIRKRRNGYHRKPLAGVNHRPAENPAHESGRRIAR